EEAAKQTPAIVLTDPGLPVVEENTRQAVEVTTRNRLLFGSGFELRLLLTQVESSNYLWHLAAELAEQEEDEQRSAMLLEISEQFKAINEQVLARVQAIGAPASESPATST